jgi:hypothetical protein
MCKPPAHGKLLAKKPNIIHNVFFDKSQVSRGSLMNRFNWRSVPWMYSILGWVMLIPMGISGSLDAQSWFAPVVAVPSVCALAIFMLLGMIGGILNICRPGFRIEGIISVGIVLSFFGLLGWFWVVLSGSGVW